ncbi:MAG: AsmA family protein [Acidobacteria bacterium]|nr:AsmA family protein [Acidobacteriota bacterium]
MASSWYRSKAFLIVAALGVLLLAGLLIAPYLLDLDRYRPLIVEQLEKATGRDIEIESLRLHFLPSIHLGVTNLRVKNPRDFPEGDTLAVERIEIGLALQPLLRRQVEITSVGVKTVALNLLQNEIGRTNYEFVRPKEARNPKSQTDKSLVTITRIDAIAVEDVTVSSGSFWQRSKRVYPSWKLTGLALALRGLDLKAADPLKSLETEIDLTSVEISSPSLKEPLRFSEGRLAIQGGAAQGNFTAALGKLRASGTLKVANLEKPVADFTLAANELNTTELAALAGAGVKGAPRSAGSALVARGTVQVGKLVVPPIVAQNFRGQARVYGNRLEVDPFSLEAFSGRAQGRLAVETASEAMPASLAVNVERVNVAQALSALNPGGKSKLTGTFGADANLGLALGAGDPLAGLGGEGTFTVRDGTFPGLDIKGTLVKMAKFLQMDVPAGDTRFSYFGGDFRIASQRVHSRQLRLEADALDADLRGSFGFDQTLDYSGTGVVKGKGTMQQEQERERNPLKAFGRVFGQVTQQVMNISGGRIPFTVRGTFADPKFLVTGPPTPIR